MHSTIWILGKKSHIHKKHRQQLSVLKKATSERHCLSLVESMKTCFRIKITVYLEHEFAVTNSHGALQPRRFLLTGVAMVAL